MKTWMKILIGLALIGIIGAGLGYKYIYNKPHKNYEKAETDFIVSSQQLYSEYKISKNEAEQKYNGTVVEVSGILDKIETPGSMTIAVFVLEEGMFGDEGIRFTMLPKHSDNLLTYERKEIKLKGYCTGYNDTDIIFEKCSIIK